MSAYTYTFTGGVSEFFTAIGRLVEPGETVTTDVPVESARLVLTEQPTAPVLPVTPAPAPVPAPVVVTPQVVADVERLAADETAATAPVEPAATTPTATTSGV